MSSQYVAHKSNKVSINYCTKDIEIVKFFLKKLTKSTMSTNVLNTLSLHYACQNGNLEAVNYLISKKADISICDAKNRSALYLACYNGFVDIIEALLAVHNNIGFLKADVETLPAKTTTLMQFFQDDSPSHQKTQQLLRIAGCKEIPLETSNNTSTEAEIIKRSNSLITLETTQEISQEILEYIITQSKGSLKNALLNLLTKIPNKEESEALECRIMSELDYYRYRNKIIEDKKPAILWLRGQAKKKFQKDFDYYIEKYIPKYKNQIPTSELQYYVFTLFDQLINQNKDLIVRENPYLQLFFMIKELSNRLDKNSKLRIKLKNLIIKSLDYYNKAIQNSEIKTPIPLLKIKETSLNIKDKQILDNALSQIRIINIDKNEIVLHQKQYKRAVNIIKNYYH